MADRKAELDRKKKRLEEIRAQRNKKVGKFQILSLKLNLSCTYFGKKFPEPLSLDYEIPYYSLRTFLGEDACA